MPKTKTVAPRTHVTGAELHLMRAFKAEADLAYERAAHAGTAAKMVQFQHEAALLSLTAQSKAAFGKVEQQVAERTADATAAKKAASDFAKQLAHAYAVDFKTTAVCPDTGELKRLET